MARGRNIYGGYNDYRTPTHPRASTREDAVVGVARVPMGMKDLRRPSPLKDDTRGVAAIGKGTAALDVTVIVEGVCIDCPGEGGNTKSVCVGAADMQRLCGLLCDDLCVLRSGSGGKSGLRPSVRVRIGPGELISTGVTGDGGTGERTPTRGGGRLFVLILLGRGVMSKDVLIAVIRGRSKDVLCAGAEGGGKRAGV